MLLLRRLMLGSTSVYHKRLGFKVLQLEHNISPCMSTLVLKEAKEKQQSFDPPSPEGVPKNYSPKILQIVDEIANMTLLEVADLNEALKKKLNISDMPMSYMAAAMPGTAAGAPKAEEEKEEAVAAPIKTSFTVKLVKFADAKKIDLIKEIKNSIPNTNLVQAKKIVESLPQVLKKDVGKGDADKLKEALEKCGGTVEIE